MPTIGAEKAVPNLRQLEYLVAVAETLSFRRAAQRTHTTQPTLSEQIKPLEMRLGVQLLERTKTKVVVTAAGKEVVEISRRMLMDAAQIRSLTRRRGKELSGLLRIGLPSGLGASILQRAGARLFAEFPQLELTLQEDCSEALLRATEEGSLDLAVGFAPMHGLDTDCLSLACDELLLAAPKTHLLAELSVFKSSDLEGEVIFALSKSHHLHDAVASLVAKAGAKVDRSFEGASISMLYELVALGRGLTFVPSLFAASHRAGRGDVQVLRASDRGLSRGLEITWRKTNSEKSKYEALAAIISSALSARPSQARKLLLSPA